MNYPQELTDFIHKLYDDSNIKNRGILNRIRKSHINIYNDIINETSWLPHDVRLVERMYCILNNLFERPLCPICNQNHTTFNEMKTGYSKTCSYKCHSNNPERKKKQKQTCLEKYGVENASQAESVKKQKRATTLKNYGVEYPFLSAVIQKKTKATLMEKYGVESPLQSSKIRQKAFKSRRNMFEDNYDVGTNYCPNIGKNETRLLNEVEQGKGIIIIRQYPVCGYIVDGYDEYNNTVYEVDEKRHEHQIEKDDVRQRNITEYLGCDFVRIKDDTH